MTERNQTMPDDLTLDRRAVRNSFERASADYDRAAVLQVRVRKELFGRLQYVRLDPELVVDLGCGTGPGSRMLKRRYRKAQVLAVDLAEGMLREAGKQQGWFTRFHRVCADAVSLPLADGSVDLIFSNLMLQWCNDLDAVFRECRRVLKPGGLLTFSTFGPDTLKELRAAWSEADDKTHVNQFIDMHDVGDAMVRAGLAEPVLDVDHYTLHYDTVLALMRDLKAIGAHNVTAGRARGLTGRGKLRAVTTAYEQFRVDGRLPATYEVVFGQAWGRRVVERRPRDPVFSIPLDSIRRRGADQNSSS